MVILLDPNFLLFTSSVTTLACLVHLPTSFVSRWKRTSHKFQGYKLLPWHSICAKQCAHFFLSNQDGREMNNILSVLLNLWAQGWACAGMDLRWGGLVLGFRRKRCYVLHKLTDTLYLLLPRGTMCLLRWHDTWSNSPTKQSALSSAYWGFNVGYASCLYLCYNSFC